MAANDSSTRRGTRDKNEDNQARLTEQGSGSAHSTGDPSSLGGTTSVEQPPTHFDVEQERSDIDGIEVMEPTDGRLGLTNVANQPPDDWAADTGETHTAEGEP